MYAADLTDLTDNVLDAIRTRPGQRVAKIARRLNADAGIVRRIIKDLAREQYVILTHQGGHDVADPRA
jgi:DNA-binding IclR family transcriptional regulator